MNGPTASRRSRSEGKHSYAEAEEEVEVDKEDGEEKHDEDEEEETQPKRRVRALWLYATHARTDERTIQVTNARLSINAFLGDQSDSD